MALLFFSFPFSSFRFSFIDNPIVQACTRPHCCTHALINWVANSLVSHLALNMPALGLLITLYISALFPKQSITFSICFCYIKIWLLNSSLLLSSLFLASRSLPLYFLTIVLGFCSYYCILFTILLTILVFFLGILIL